MASYMFLYHSEPFDMSAVSPEEMQASMQAWMKWIGKGTEAGWMLEAGDALHGTGKIVNPDKSVTDGPFTEAKEVVGGYSIIQADSFEQAAEYAKGCPEIVRGGRVEIRELAKVMENAGQH